MKLGSNKAAGDRAIVTIGLGITSSDAFVNGAGSMPDPAGDPGYPWLYWSDSWLLAEVAAAEHDTEGSAVYRMQVDTKAMRKVKPAETLSWVVQLSGLVGAPTVHINIARLWVLIGI